MTKKDDRIRNLYDALAESVVEASDNEILEECRESGESPEKVAAHMRDVLRRAWTEHQQRPLNEARQTYLRAASVVHKTKPNLPRTAQERRTLLMGIVAQHPEAGQTLMAQFRDFEEMSDEDIESWLEKFARLGLLPRKDESNG